MTYCVAWKTNTSAFVLIDSAVTSTQQASLSLTHSSFGEAQGESKNGYTYEAANKIYRIENLLIALAGDSSAGEAFIIEVFNYIKDYGLKPDKAIESAFNNHINPQTSRKFNVIVIFYSDRPNLWTLCNYQSTIEKDINFTHIGNPSDDLKKYTKSFNDAFLKSWHDECQRKDADRIFFMRMLALLQVYCIHNATFQYGIGGYFTGAYLDSAGITHAPSTCFLIVGESIAHDRTDISALFSGDNFSCLVSTLSECNTFYKNTLYDKSQEDHSKLFELKISNFDNAEFDYVILLSREIHSAYIVEMKNKKHHKELYINIDKNEIGKIELFINNRINILLNDNFIKITEPKHALIGYHEYEPPDSDRPNKVLSNIDSIRRQKEFNQFKYEFDFVIEDEYGQETIFKGAKEQFFYFINEYIHLKKKIVIRNDSSCFFEYEKSNIIKNTINYSTPQDNKLPQKRRDRRMYILKHTNNKYKILAKNKDAAIDILQKQIKCSKSEINILEMQYYHPMV